MSMNILITGGAGFIGSHTVLELLKVGHTVICIDNGCNSYLDAKAEFPESIKRVHELTGKKVIFYSVDIRDKNALNQVFKKHKIDCVAHFAALKAVGESCRLPLQYYQNNITGTSVLLEVMSDNGVFNFVYSSSATVYGEPQFLPLTEDHPTGNCTNPYGKSKYFTEEILKDLCASDKRWNVISLRYFNPVGSHESGQIGEDPNGEPNNLMPYISQVAVGKLKVLKVFGNDYPTHDGTGVRDYIHIVDLAEGHLAALDKLKSGDVSGFVVYNLGTGCGYSVLDMVKNFSKSCGHDIPYEIAPRRPGDIASCYASTEKAEKELGWKAKKGLKEMCDDAWRWQKNNPNGFSGLQSDL
ncbi:CLUMA_CG009038, isoform A [Clunio marinus]|uniref:UDP-glucose 4-epimerase n=1 Tax=Clunio marinus TaxID=568069 RepID=A0A1J1IAW3_9DIPT|nr:CLUMA_CG009038, isoform A [Clunio marinus]